MFIRLSLDPAGVALLGAVTILLAASCTPASPPLAPVEAVPETAAPPSGPPNVIWILMDTLRAENLSCYGYHRPTSPTIDALAARGVVFENHFSQGLWTMISVPSIMTGRYFPVNVVENFDYRVIHRHPPMQQRTAPEIFKQNGYKTAMFTAHRLLVSESTRLGQAFDEAFPVLNPAGTKPHGTFADVNDAFFAWQPADDGRPFFAYLHLMDNHFPHMPTGKYAQWLNDDYSREVFGPAGPIDTDQHFAEPDMRRMAGLYDGDILFVDDQLKRLLGHLDRKGVLNNTIVVITSDHGDLLGEDGESWGHDGFSQDQIMKVPWIMAGPGIPEGVRVSGMTENVDVLPTLVDFLDFNTDADFDGGSVAPRIMDEPVTRSREYTFARNPSKRHYDYPTSFILRTDAFKYELDSDTGEEHLWQVPDNAGGRVDVLDENRAVAADLKAILEREFRPRFDAYMATEIRWILGRIGGGQSENWYPADAVRVMARNETADDLGTDNLWVSTPTLAGPNFLTSCGWLENPPPVTMRYPVPDGRYHVSVELGRHKLLNDRASSLLIKAENDSAYAPVRFDTGDEPWLYVYGGTWTVDDGSFDIELNKGGIEDWASIRRLRMHPASNATHSFPIASLFEQRRGGSPITIGPAEAYVVGISGSEDDAANRWRIVRSRTAPFATLVPPVSPDGTNQLTISLQVPKGLYALDLEIESESGEFDGLRFDVNGESVFRTVDSTGDTDVDQRFIHVGYWPVVDGSFELTLDCVANVDPFALTGLYLIPVSDDGIALDSRLLTHRGIHPADPENADTAVEVDREELENIGYVN